MDKRIVLLFKRLSFFIADGAIKDIELRDTKYSTRKDNYLCNYSLILVILVLLKRYLNLMCFSSKYYMLQKFLSVIYMLLSSVTKIALYLLNFSVSSTSCIHYFINKMTGWCVNLIMT
jgi:hypothetical protein